MKTKAVMLVLVLLLMGVSVAPAVWAQQAPDSLVCEQSELLLADSSHVFMESVKFFDSGEPGTVTWFEEPNGGTFAIGAFHFGVWGGWLSVSFTDSTVAEVLVRARNPQAFVLVLELVEPFPLGKRAQTLQVADVSREEELGPNSSLVAFTATPEGDIILTHLEGCVHNIRTIWSCHVQRGLQGPDSGRVSRGAVFLQERSGLKFFGHLGGNGYGACGEPTSLDVRWLGAQLRDQGIPVAVEADEVPSGVVLEGNYPNPFNLQTTISFLVPETAHMRLVVYDMLGRQVVVLVDGVRAVGTHEAVFDGSGLPSGTYLYRLETLRGVEARRMVLMR